MAFEDEVKKILKSSHSHNGFKGQLEEKIEVAISDLVEKISALGLDAAFLKKESTEITHWAIVVENYMFSLFSHELIRSSDPTGSNIEKVTEEAFIETLREISDDDDDAFDKIIDRLLPMSGSLE